MWKTSFRTAESKSWKSSKISTNFRLCPSFNSFCAWTKSEKFRPGRFLDVSRLKASNWSKSKSELLLVRELPRNSLTMFSIVFRTLGQLFELSRRYSRATLLEERWFNNSQSSRNMIPWSLIFWPNSKTKAGTLAFLGPFFWSSSWKKTHKGKLLYMTYR